MAVLCIILIILMSISKCSARKLKNLSRLVGGKKRGEDTWIYGREILKEINLFLFFFKAE